MKVFALMKQKMLVTVVACNLTYGQIQVLSDHVFISTGKPGINVYLEDSSNHLEYFEMFCTPQSAEENIWFEER
jgi:hypothetical protein